MQFNNQIFKIDHVNLFNESCSPTTKFVTKLCPQIVVPLTIYQDLTKKKKKNPRKFLYNNHIEKDVTCNINNKTIMQRLQNKKICKENCKTYVFVCV